MSGKPKRAGLSSKPPGPRNLEEFLGGAETPRAERKAPRREIQPPAAEPVPEPESQPRHQVAAPDFEIEGTENFLLRLSGKHHAMLKWLSKNSRRRSMQAIALDLLEPAIEDAVRKLDHAKTPRR